MRVRRESREKNEGQTRNFRRPPRRDCRRGFRRLREEREGEGQRDGGRTKRGRRDEEAGEALAVFLRRRLPPHGGQSFVLIGANDTESRHLQEILKIYEEVSGQAINMTKSEIFFSSNTPQEMGSLSA